MTPRWRRHKDQGAQVLLQPTDLEDVGRFAVLKDPQGAAFALFQPGNEVSLSFLGLTGKLPVIGFRGFVNPINACPLSSAIFFTYLFQLGYFGPLVMGVLDSSFLFLPFGNDLLVVGLIARHHQGFILYVLAAATGSMLGVLLLDLIARKARRGRNQENRRSQTIRIFEAQDR